MGKGKSSGPAGFWLALGLLTASAVGATTRTYDNMSPGVTLPSGGSAMSTLNVADVGLITDLNVINLTQRTPYAGRLTITLTDPTGTVSVLVKESGDGGTADSLENIDFDDSAASEFPGFRSDGQCITNATYRSHENLSAFNGLQVNGLWTLTVADTGGGGLTDCDCAITSGPPCDRALANWGLEITFDPLPPCDKVTVANQTIAMMETKQACRELEGGPMLTISNTLGVKLFAGETVALKNGVTVNTDAKLDVGVCGQNLCSTGSSLEPTCSPCVTSICTADPFCCSSLGSWDFFCVFKVGSICNLGCP